MTLFRKAALAFTLLALLTVVGEYLVISGATSSMSGLEDYQSRTAVHQRAVRAMITNWYAYDDQNNAYVLLAATSVERDELVESTYARAQDVVEVFTTNLQTARDTGSAEDEALFDAIATDFERYDTFARQAREAQLAGYLNRAAALITVDIDDVSNQLMTDLETAEAQADARARAAVQDLEDTQARMRQLAVAVGVAVVLGLLLLGVFFLRAVLRPLHALGRRMDDIATGDGDLTARVDETRSDEIGAMARSFNVFIIRIQGVMVAFSESIVALLAASEALRAITETTADNAGRTATNAQSAAGSASEVATHISSIAAGATQMGASIGEIARNAAHAAAVASSGRERALDTSHRVQQLSASSSEIDSVVRVIAAIAEQTNLLALNATIEAARAGQAGRGFAVVASEVKELAAETAAATSDITRKVAAIQADTERAVSSVDEITAVIEEISGISDAIAAAVEQQSATTDEITRSAADVAGNAGAITTDIANVATAVGDTSTGVSASSDTIQELAELSASLDGLISQFRIV